PRASMTREILCEKYTRPSFDSGNSSSQLAPLIARGVPQPRQFRGSGSFGVRPIAKSPPILPRIKHQIAPMCTVTFWPTRKGYRLAMNRDEKWDRPAGLPPTRQILGKRAAIFPNEPMGGTWIGLNDLGVAFALVNWYSVAQPVLTKSTSRGAVV